MIRSKLKVMRPIISLGGSSCPRLSYGVACMNQLMLAGLAVRIDSGFTWKRCEPSESGRPIARARAPVSHAGGGSGDAARGGGGGRGGDAVPVRDQEEREVVELVVLAVHHSVPVVRPPAVLEHADEGFLLRE